MSDAVRCLAVTAKGARCANQAQEDSVLCALHERVVADRHADAHVESAGDNPVLHIAATEQQDPLVVTVFWAADHASAEAWAGDDDAMAHSVTQALHRNGGGLPDVDLLVQLGVLPDWVRGYWRGAGYPAERPEREPAYLDTDSGLIPVWVPEAERTGPLPNFLRATPAGG